MNVILQPKAINGVLKIPSSKSSMQRAIAAAILTNGKTILKNPDFSNDSKAALKVAENLGKIVEFKDDVVIISGERKIKNKTISVGESGLGIRMFSPVVSLFDEEITVTGKGSLKARPMDMIKKPLQDLGVRVLLNDKFLPIKIKGPIKGGKITVDGSSSSQFLTGLLMALPNAKNNSEITVLNLKSKPYIDLTISILSDFEVEVTHKNYQTFYIKGNQRFKETEYSVEGDWSSASFHIVAAAIAGKVELIGLDFNSTQADKKILEAVEQFGATITKGNSLIIEKNKNNSFNFDATDCPDLFPPLVVLAAASNGICRIKGVSRLAHKESNRALVLQKEFFKLGLKILLNDDIMEIEPSKLKGGTVHSNFDHRIAMAEAIASLISSEPITILETQAVNKSYPDFFEDFDSICK